MHSWKRCPEVADASGSGKFQRRNEECAVQTYDAQVGHEEFQRADLVIIDFVWDIEFAQERAERFLIILW